MGSEWRSQTSSREQPLGFNRSSNAQIRQAGLKLCSGVQPQHTLQSHSRLLQDALSK